MGDPEAREELLFSRWYRGLLDAALVSRLRRGITQTRIAETMGTRQPAIARIERDDDGGISARRLWAYLRACGLVPMADVVDEDTVLASLQDDPAQSLHAASFAVRARSGTSIPVDITGWVPHRPTVMMDRAGTTTALPRVIAASDWVTQDEDRMHGRSIQARRVRRVVAA